MPLQLLVYILVHCNFTAGVCCGLCLCLCRSASVVPWFTESAYCDGLSNATVAVYAGPCGCLARHASMPWFPLSLLLFVLVCCRSAADVERDKDITDDGVLVSSVLLPASSFSVRCTLCTIPGSCRCQL